MSKNDQTSSSAIPTTFKTTLVGLILSAAGITLALDQGVAKDPRKPQSYGEIVVRARPIGHFENSAPDKNTFGRLKWRGGLSLLSTSQLFGGISGFVLGDGGKKFIAVTDRGSWITGELVYEGTRPRGFRSVIIGPLRARNGRPLRTKRDQDAEGIAFLKGTISKGTLLISFERNHRIGRFPLTVKGIGKPSKYLRLPKGLRGVTRNKGLEAITVIKSGRYAGRVLIFAERKLSRNGNLQGWILQGRKSTPILLKRIGGYDITDLATLPSGDILVLERRFRWSEGIRVRLRLIPHEALRSGKLIRGEILVEADGGFAIDNMEGLAVHQTDSGQTIITLVSDDNFSVLQRTLLLQFELLEKVKISSDRDKVSQ